MPDTAPGRPLRCLFLCTGNSARSVLAEATLNARGGGRWQALSAGSHPAGRVHPQALAQLAAEGIPTGGLASKSWDTLVDSEPVDIVVTVCDAAAGETCPVFPGKPTTAHWGIPDPAAAAPDDAPRAFADAWRVLARRIDAMLAEPLVEQTPAERRATLERIAAKYPAA